MQLQQQHDVRHVHHVQPHAQNESWPTPFADAVTVLCHYVRNPVGRKVSRIFLSANWRKGQTENKEMGNMARLNTERLRFYPLAITKVSQWRYLQPVEDSFNCFSSA